MASLRIAVLGAGPVGLEAALYARCLGFPVRVYEQGRVGEHLLRVSHVRWFTPWRMICSPLAQRMLQLHHGSWSLPWKESPRADQICHRLLEPLMQLPMMKGVLCAPVQVVAVSRQGKLKTDLDDRAQCPFRLLLQDGRGRQWTEEAEVVLDCTGTLGRPNPLGCGGIPAPGELRCQNWIEHSLPDLQGADRERFANRRILVVGSGYSAGTNVVALAQLMQQASRTEVWWVVRRPLSSGQGPLPRVAQDPLPLRDQLAQEANHLAWHHPQVHLLPGTQVDALQPQGTAVRVQLTGTHAGELVVDRILANTGYRGHWDLLEELQVQRCWATDGPLRLAAALLKQNSTDCLQLSATGYELLQHPEPGLFVLGAKSYGRNSQFLLTQGWNQVRDVFRWICQDEHLDLYACEKIPTKP